jgi:hypothetical protein
VVRGTEDLASPNSIWRVPLDGGTADSVGIVSESIGEMRLDPAGRQLAFASGNVAAELWVMEHIVPTPSRSVGKR